jgi:DNA-binding NarL/FixJ family response regulator
MNRSIRVLIVDDHPVVRDGLKGMLSGRVELTLVGEAENGMQAVEMAEILQPDVVLMDLRMPQMDGAAATAEIRRRHPAVHILVLTTYDTDADILRAIEAGAAGYLLKDAPREELYRAIQSTAQGQSYLSPPVAARLVEQLRAPLHDQLSPREVDVLNWVARGASNKEIARELHISEATVKSHLLHIFEKLGVDDRTQAVTLAVQKGIIHLIGGS